MNPAEILKNLGIDETLFFQFGIFFIAYLAMDFIVFRPYLRAYNERLRRTQGSREEAQHILRQVDQKEEEYRVLVRKLNGEINSVFTESNIKAKKDMERILSKAKKDSEHQSRELSEKIDLLVTQTRRDLENRVPGISSEIQKKLMEY